MKTAIVMPHIRLSGASGYPLRDERCSNVADLHAELASLARKIQKTFEELGL